MERLVSCTLQQSMDLWAVQDKMQKVQDCEEVPRRVGATWAGPGALLAASMPAMSRAAHSCLTALLTGGLQAMCASCSNHTA